MFNIVVAAQYFSLELKLFLNVHNTFFWSDKEFLDSFMAWLQREPSNDQNIKSKVAKEAY